jgi:dolichyl-phosphate beta-glucosyltransferase
MNDATPLTLQPPLLRWDGPDVPDTCTSPDALSTTRTAGRGPDAVTVVERRRAPRVVPDLSIVVLAYQEEARIGASLIELSAHLTRTGRRGVEVLVVAASRPDGTSDRTLEIVEGKRPLFEDLRVVVPGTMAGKGRDAKFGMLTARGRHRIFMDADLATPLHHLDTSLALLEAGHDAVIGVRDLTASHEGLRKVISKVGNLLVQALLLPGISDSQCGFKLFTADAAHQVFARQTIDGWGFDMEVLAIARTLGCRVATHEVPDWTDVAGGTFSDAALRGTVRTLQDLLVIKWRVVRGRYRRLRVAVPYPAASQRPDLRVHAVGQVG